MNLIDQDASPRLIEYFVTVGRRGLSPVFYDSGDAGGPAAAPTDADFTDDIDESSETSSVNSEDEDELNADAAAAAAAASAVSRRPICDYWAGPLNDNNINNDNDSDTEAGPANSANKTAANCADSDAPLSAASLNAQSQSQSRRPPPPQPLPQPRPPGAPASQLLPTSASASAANAASHSAAFGPGVVLDARGRLDLPHGSSLLPALLDHRRTLQSALLTLARSRLYRSGLLDRYPRCDRPTHPMPPTVSLFCVPAGGVPLTDAPDLPKLSYFACTLAGGERMFGTCIVIQEPVPEAEVVTLLRSMEAQYEAKHFGPHACASPTNSTAAGKAALASSSSGSGGGLVASASGSNPSASTGSRLAPPTLSPSTSATSQSAAAAAAAASNNSSSLPTWLRLPPSPRLAAAVRAKLPALPTLYTTKVICLLSCFPFLAEFRTTLIELYRLTLSPCALPLERYLSVLLHDTPLPALGGARVQLNLSSFDPLVLRRLHGQRVLAARREAVRRGMGPLLEKLSLLGNNNGSGNGNGKNKNNKDKDAKSDSTAVVLAGGSKKRSSAPESGDGDGDDDGDEDEDEDEDEEQEHADLWAYCDGLLYDDGDDDDYHGDGNDGDSDSENLGSDPDQDDSNNNNNNDGDDKQNNNGSSSTARRSPRGNGADTAGYHAVAAAGALPALMPPTGTASGSGGAPPLFLHSRMPLPHLGPDPFLARLAVYTAATGLVGKAGGGGTVTPGT